MTTFSNKNWPFLTGLCHRNQKVVGCHSSFDYVNSFYFIKHFMKVTDHSILDEMDIQGGTANIR